jgi:hypothetical protein
MGLCWCDSGTGSLLCYGFGTGIWQACESTPVADIAVNRHQSSISSLESLLVSTSKYPQLYHDVRLVPLIAPGLQVRSPTPMDSKLELESDSDESESGAHFWPFTLRLLPPIPTDETDALADIMMHPLVDGEDQTRPECEFVLA